jgi:uncharacterized SAM-binding protein YcdF (DUF218 family)
MTGSREVQLMAPPRSRTRGWKLRAALALVAAVLIVCVAAAVDIVTSARDYDTTHTDAIAVLGASQYWGKPSPIFENRLDHARDLWAEGVAPVIITVGGKIDGDITTEAEAGRKYLINQGVPPDAVIALPAGSNTIESIEMIDTELESRGADSVTLVSDRLHLARCKAIARAMGLQVHVSGRAFSDGSSFQPERMVREMGGLLRFQVWDRWFIHDQSAG